MTTLKKYALPAVAVLAVVLAVIVVSLPKNGALSPQPGTTGPGGHMTKLGEGAFGSLTQVQSDSPRSASQESGVAVPGAPTAGFGGGGGLSSGQSGSATADSKLIAPGIAPYPGDYVQYTFAYKGEPLTLNDASVDVFRRTKNGAGARASGDILSLAGNLVNLGSFPNLNLQYFTVSQDADFGYDATVDLRENTAYINANYLKWPHPEQQCQDEACFSQYRLKPENVPDDATVIGIAKVFLADHNISTANFGDPEVRNEWREYLKVAADPTTIYVPDSVTVVFPQIVDGSIVYDEGGQTQGLYVNVNVRQNKVDGVWNLLSQNFESSAYAAVTDSAKLISIAEQGGIYGNYLDPNAKTVTLELGTPSRVLVRVYRYTPGAYSSDELYVPALLFPITQPPADQPYYRKNIIVPLAQDLLTVPGGGVIQPLEATTDSAPASAPIR